MSANAEPAQGDKHMKRLADVPVAKVQPNKANPRIHFTEEEIERLTESIDRKGILVPVVVYERDGGFVLTDGERRWRCAKALGLTTIPAVITERPDEDENLVQMFNIHMVREAWKDMPTAIALGRVIKEFGIESDKELADMTGLSVERIKRLRHALTLPDEYRRYIDEGRVPLNFFYELKRSVIDPLARKRPSLSEELGKDGVLDAFVAKRLAGVVSDTVSLRLVTPIINVAEREVEEPTDSSPLDETLKRLIQEPGLSISEAYEDTVQVVFETEKLSHRVDNMVKSFTRLLGKARSNDEREHIRAVGRDLIDRVKTLIT
jgi:ParB family transcriptional regulator, chromosome partitioning protein